MDKYIGKMLDGRYELLEVMGVGGMAYVYKARCHALNRLVAVKILKEEFADDDEFRRRFHDESKAVAMLNHPNIVAVHDVSRSSEMQYIVMELVDGITLKQYMSKKGILSWREALHFASQIVKALSHAHSKDIVHRDIKPHNIMVLRDGSVRVADFGIARIASKQHTLKQEALGSVHYISPEQAKGSTIDQRSDLYSVGVVMYEMLTGRLPFEGDSPVSVAIQHINSMPLTPREINEDIPEALEIITIKAMAPALAKRYARAEDMLHDLEEFRKNPAIMFDYAIDDLRPHHNRADAPAIDLASPIAQPKTVSVSINPNSKKRSSFNQDARDDENWKTKKSSDTIAVLLAVFFVMLVLSILGWWVYAMAADLFAPEITKKLPIPDLSGKYYSEALIREYEDEFVIAEHNDCEWEYSDIYEVNTIISQKPKPGKQTSRGTKISLVISLGKEGFILQDQNGKRQAQATLALQNDGLVAKIEKIVDPDVLEGSVIRTEPASGETVFKGDEITVFVSLGPIAGEVTMPRLVGRSLQDARAVLITERLERGREDMVPSDKPAGQVVGQSVRVGDKVAEYTTVDLQISQGSTEGASQGPGGEDD
ncbi:MAG: Stk1 family PASTA domain-containing Ser/Thr kinase [Oscillospiraceae bacterium]|nr:Stk1 family PASTA domain-containing Ser/Thr kinase [Oscillospiraceae bacterium]